MSYLIDSKRNKPTLRRNLLILLALVALVAIFSATTILSSWVDLQWFRSLNYADVFWKMLSLQVGVFFVIAALTLPETRGQELRSLAQETPS